MENKLLNIDNYNFESLNLSSIARSYSTISNKKYLSELLSNIFKQDDFKQKTKYELHHLFNELIFTNCKNEISFKGILLKHFINKNITAALEIKTNTSRLDFLTINGITTSYEIKSAIDNLDKLDKQLNDYLALFEYNFVVIDEKHLVNIINSINENIGIYIIYGNEIIIKKKSFKSCNLNSEKQLNLFTKKELMKFFSKESADKMKIINNYDGSQINSVFKRMLKIRYREKWEFFKNNYNHILPIDYQFFYHHNISPSTIYHT
jgi:hypothetical protein